MYCTECGAKLLEGAYFCGECGQIQFKRVVQDAKAKKEDAIAALIDVTKNKLYYTAFRFLKDDAAAEDILQESYIQAFQSLDSLQDENKFISWMTKIIINRCKNYVSIKKNTQFTDFSSLDTEEENYSFEQNIQEDRLEFVPDKNFNYEQLKQGLDQVLDELPDNQRMAILLYYLDEFKVKEVADIMNVSQGTIKSLLNYGRKAIKNKIEELRKQNKSFYFIVPIPFLVWMLKEEVKAQSITPHLVQNVMKGIETSDAVSSAGAVTGLSSKTVVTSGTKGIFSKVLTGILAVTIGTGVIGGGYALSQTIFKQDSNTYEIIEDAVDDFDFAPIAFHYTKIEEGAPFYNPSSQLLDTEVSYYIASVDGKFGILDGNNQWVKPPQYRTLYYNDFGSILFSLTSSETGRDNDYYSDIYNIMHYVSVGSGVLSNFEIKEENGKLKPYVSAMDISAGLSANRKEYDFFDESYAFDGMTFATYEDVWYLIDKLGNCYGPYKMDEIPCYQANVLQNKGWNGRQYVFGFNIGFSFNSMFYAPEKDQYRIYNYDASQKSEHLYDEVSVLSDSWMMAKRDDKTFYIDSDLKEYEFGDLVDVSEPIEDSFYAKKDGKWKFIKAVNKSKKDIKSKNNDSMIEAYKLKVSTFGAWVESEEYSVAEYSLYDINHDGIIELIIKNGTCEADYTYSIYTYANKLFYIGNISASHADLAIDPDGIGIYRNTAHMGVQYVDRIMLEGIKLKEENVMEPTEFPQGQDYIEYESIPYYNYDDDTGFKICA